MPPRLKVRKKDPQVLEWAAAYRERHGIPADEPFDFPLWRRPPAFLLPILEALGRPRYYRFHPDGTIEPVDTISEEER